MKKINLLLLIAVIPTLILGTLLAATAAPATPEKKWNLSLGTWGEPTHPVTTVCHKNWADTIEKRTKGRVKITLYPGGVFGQPAAHMEKLRSGVLDISQFIPALMAGMYPIAEGVGRLPFVGSSPWAAAKALWQMYTEHLFDKSWDTEMHLLWIGSNLSASPIFLGKKEVVTLADMKGLKLRGTGATMKMALDKVGAVMVVINTSELQQGMERGVVDGGVTNYAGAGAAGLIGTVKYIIETKPALALGNIGLTMNKALWESFPPDIQQIVNEESGLKGALAQVEAYDMGDAAAKAKFIASGTKIRQFSKADIDTWTKLTANVKEDWLKEMAAKGLEAPARKAADRYVELVQKYEAEEKK
jgi:TRAP-type C4-dicarboxylate transport system substrate-binding protein